MRAAALGAVVGLLLMGCTAGTTSGGGTPSAKESAPAAASTGLAASPQPSALLNETPDPHSTVGGLARDFPSDLLPGPDGAEILVSSVDPVGDSTAYQVSLNLRSTLPAASIVALYRTSLTSAGFSEAKRTTPDAALAAQSTFTRSGGDELLVIGVLDRAGIRTVTIGGRLRRAG